MQPTQQCTRRLHGEWHGHQGSHGTRQKSGWRQLRTTIHWMSARQAAIVEDPHETAARRPIGMTFDATSNRSMFPLCALYFTVAQNCCLMFVSYVFLAHFEPFRFPNKVGMSLCTLVYCLNKTNKKNTRFYSFGVRWVLMCIFYGPETRILHTGQLYRLEVLQTAEIVRLFLWLANYYNDRSCRRKPTQLHTAITLGNRMRQPRHLGIRKVRE